MPWYLVIFGLHNLKKNEIAGYAAKDLNSKKGATVTYQ